MPTIILLCGAPGSGKSTMAKKLVSNRLVPRHFEADMFFETQAGYKFRPEAIKEAHLWCQIKVINVMQSDRDDIVVSNTFTRAWERKPYLDMAQKYGYAIKFAKLPPLYSNVHGVPVEKVLQMERRFENFTEEELFAEHLGEDR